MDENISWKVVYIACIFSLLVLGLAYYLISPKESPFFSTEETEKIAEFKATRFSGRKNGNKVWEFYAEAGWAAKDRITTHLEKIKLGKIYQDNQLVVTNLTAPSAKTFAKTEIVEVFGPLKAQINLGKISNPNEDKPDEWTRLKADYLKYFPKEKRSEIKNNVELKKKDSLVFANEMLVNHKDKIADMKGKISMQRKDGILRSDNMQYISQQERLEADGNVDLKIKEGPLKTDLKCNHSSFFMDMEKDMTLQGNLEVAQGKKIAVAKSGVYSQTRKELAMQGSTKAIFEKANAILKEKTVKNLKNSDAKKILKEKTVLISDKLVFSTKTGDAKASGSIFITQQGREAKADYAEYNEKEENITLSGNVYLKKKTDWVKAKKVVVSVIDETFEAFGEVEAEFKL